MTRQMVSDCSTALKRAISEEHHQSVDQSVGHSLSGSLRPVAEAPSSTRSSVEEAEVGGPGSNGTASSAVAGSPDTAVATPKDGSIGRSGPVGSASPPGMRTWSRRRRQEQWWRRHARTPRGLTPLLHPRGVLKRMCRESYMGTCRRKFRTKQRATGRLGERERESEREKF